MHTNEYFKLKLTFRLTLFKNSLYSDVVLIKCYYCLVAVYSLAG